VHASPSSQGVAGVHAPAGCVVVLEDVVVVARDVVVVVEVVVLAGAVALVVVADVSVVVVDDLVGVALKDTDAPRLRLARRSTSFASTSSARKRLSSARRIIGAGRAVEFDDRKSHWRARPRPISGE
jgi:hypothetical protein